MTSVARIASVARQRHLLRVACLLLLTWGLSRVAAAQAFSDGFEAATIDPFWSSTQQNGSIQLAGFGLGVVHSGLRSVQLKGNPGGQVNVWLSHIFARTQGTLSVWFYDSGPGLYAGLYAYDSADASLAFAANVADWSATQYIWHGPGVNETTTALSRSVGWHHFELRIGGAGFTALIDDTVVGAVAGSFTFDTVQLLVSGPSGGSTYFFDDFSFCPGEVACGTSGGSLSGHVTNQQTTAPLAGVTIRAFNSAGALVATTSSGPDGSYTIGGLPTGSYFVRTQSPPGFLNELFNNRTCLAGCQTSSGDAVAVTSSTPAINVDFALSPGGVISGVLSQAGVPFNGGTQINIFNDAGLFVNSTLDSLGYVNGRYAVTVPAGTYRAQTDFFDGFNEVNEAFDNIQCENLCPGTTGTPIALTIGAVRDDINFSVEPGARISGVVTDAVTGLPISGVTVVSYTSAGLQARTALRTGSDGRFTIAGLLPGPHYLRTRVPDPRAYADEIYGGVPCTTQACDVTAGTPVQVNFQSLTDNVNFALSAPGGLATPVITVTGGTFIYDGSPHPATAVATGTGGEPVSGSFAITYTPGGSAVPVNPGVYTASAAFSSTNSNYANGSGEAGITIALPPCDVSLLPSSQSFPAQGGVSTFQVAAASTCGWSAFTSATWISLQSNFQCRGDVCRGHAGNGSVTFSVQANTSTAARSGTVSVGAREFVVQQQGLNCTYSISPTGTTFSNAATSARIVVTAPTGCGWTASSNVPWMTLPPGSGGNGNGAVTIAVSANAGSPRSGTVTIAGRTFSGTQGTGACGALDVSSQVSVTRGFLMFVPPAGSNLYTQTLTIRNTSGATVRGPVYVVLGGMPTHNPPTSPIDYSNTGLSFFVPQTRCFSAAGDYLLQMSGDLSPGQSVMTTLSWIQGHPSIAYSTKVLSGTPSN